jgi:hypothetical protein
MSKDKPCQRDYPILANCPVEGEENIIVTATSISEDSYMQVKG